MCEGLPLPLTIIRSSGLLTICSVSSEAPAQVRNKKQDSSRIEEQWSEGNLLFSSKGTLRQLLNKYKVEDEAQIDQHRRNRIVSCDHKTIRVITWTDHSENTIFYACIHEVDSVNQSGNTSTCHSKNTINAEGQVDSPWWALILHY
jgi:hypothetical protein